MTELDYRNLKQSNFESFLNHLNKEFHFFVQKFEVIFFYMLYR